MQSCIRRINFYGAPGTGKTVLAHELFVYAKQHGKNCEVINELAREWAYVDRKIQGLDQLLLFANQASREDICLRNNAAEFVITDSPVPLAVFYSLLYDKSLRNSYEGMTRKIDEVYPSVNFFCTHNPRYEYHLGGRHHSRQQSEILGDQMLSYLQEYYGDQIHILPEERRLQKVISILNNYQIGPLPSPF